jgi:GT2 family glycosyltransferase
LASSKVAVAILNWNGVAYLHSFLGKVCEYSIPEAEVWIIDNASSDSSLEYVRDEFPQVKIVELPENLGFADGYNEGLKSIDAEYYVLLNSDVEVTPNWINPVIQFIESDSQMVAAQPLIMDQRRKEYFEHAGAAGGYIDRDGFPFCAGRIFDSFEKNQGQYAENREVFWASGAALFMKSEYYFKSGGLDGDFFAHMEEIDLCWRLKNSGFKIGACGKSMVYHVGGGTLNKQDPRKTYLNFRNNLYLLLKNDFEGLFFLKLLRRLALDGIAGLRFLTEGKPKFFSAVLKAHFSFYRNLPKMYFKRLVLRKLAKKPNNHGRFRASILVHYFLKKQKHFIDLPSDLFSS